MAEPTGIQPPGLRAGSSAERDELARRLWNLWRQGQQPRVDDFLAQAGAGDAGQILDVLLVDQAERFRSGQGISAEAYLDGFPTVRDDPEQAVDLIFAEYLLREELGEQPAPEDYLRRFPQYAGALELQVELHRAMETGRALPSTRTESSAALVAPADESRPPVAEERLPQVPGYEIVNVLGSGGMGVVYRAHQRRLNRPVAVKIIRPGMDSRQVIARFETERQALALMDHPNIAQVLDAGTTDSGHPYFVMDLVEGVPITEYCDRNRLTVRQRLELFIPVCQAVQHAHQKGIIHRDIKPSNVLVTQSDGTPVPKVIDFGLAKAIDRRLAETTMYTQLGVLLGTFEYMSPEQSEMGALDLDTRSDIYSLGVVLYELLTGSTPLDQTRLRGAAFTEILRRIREEDPPRPSTRLSESKNQSATIAARRQSEPARVPELVRGELDWIVMKALEKARSRRYETANGLAKDIQRYLDSDPVEAGPPSATYRLRTLARKHRAALAAAAAFVAVLITATAISTWQAARALRAEGHARKERDRAVLAEIRAQANLVHARAEQKRAEQSETEAKAVLDFVQAKILAAARPKEMDGGLGIHATIRAAIDAVEPTISASFAEQPIVEASIRNTLGESYWYLGEPAQAIRQHERALELRRLTRGPDHPETLRSMGNLGAAYLAAGEDVEAVHLFEEAYRLQQIQLGPDHLDTLESMNNLAVAYANVGRNADALRLHEQEFRRTQARLGPDHPDTLISLSNLGVEYRMAGRFDDAFPLFEQAWKRSEARLGPDHLDTLVAKINLAKGYRDKGRLDDALPLLEDAVKRIQAQVDPDHPQLLFGMGDLANAYREAGRIADALGLYEEALERSKTKLGPDHRNTLRGMNNLANAYRDSGRLSEAVTLHEETLARRRAKLGPDHPDTVQSLENLGRCCLLACEPARAEPLLREALATREKKSPNDWGTFDIRSALGACLLRQEKYAEAEPLLIAGYTGLEARASKIPAPSKHRLPEAGAAILDLYQAWGKNDKAAEWKARLSAAAKTAPPEP
jgi:serine/threonine protein kinase/Tfp pilus assembly protein PilF